MNRILITGATGFVGTRLISYVLKHTDWDVVAMTRRQNIEPDFPRLRWLRHDLSALLPDTALAQLTDVNLIVHAAGEVSGIKSISNPMRSVRANVLGTYHLLEAARRLDLQKFVYISTGEVVGAVDTPLAAAEDAPLRPSNPYAASKAAGEELCRAYHLSFGVPVVTVRSMNLFGPAQSLDRFIPTVASRFIMNEKVVCHVDEAGKPGSRNWLHIDQFIETLVQVISLDNVGETYHIVGPQKTNMQIINLVATALGKVTHVEEKIPGSSHDFRYALLDTKLGLNFEQGFEKRVWNTARWYA